MEHTKASCNSIILISCLPLLRVSNKKKRVEIDNDVIAEKKRVYSQGQNDTLVVKGLSKQYTLHNLTQVLAVDDLSFGVTPGQVRLV